jgi:tripartite-type tricarboxylate transporter receptor subunit TctC
LSVVVPIGDKHGRGSFVREVPLADIAAPIQRHWKSDSFGTVRGERHETSPPSISTSGSQRCHAPVRVAACARRSLSVATYPYGRTVSARGATDIVARPVAQMLGDALKSTVIIDNRGGAGGSVGANAVAKASSDAYTLLMGTVGTHAISPTLYKKLPYDAVRDFTPIALVASAPVTIVMHPSQPASDLASLVAQAKRVPGKLNYGTAGNGTPGHLTGAMFKAAAGIAILHVPYKGGAPAIVDLLAGHIQMMFEPLPSVMSHVRAGTLRAIAVSSAARSPMLPNVPTIAESGYSGFEFAAWWGVFARANRAQQYPPRHAGAARGTSHCADPRCIC